MKPNPADPWPFPMERPPDNPDDLPPQAVFSAPAARKGDPDTSHDAARGARSGASRGRKLALRALYTFNSGTDFDLARYTGLQQTSIGKRRLDLERAGFVESIPTANGEGVEKRKTPSGAWAIVWRLTAAGTAEAEKTFL